MQEKKRTKWLSLTNKSINKKKARSEKNDEKIDKNNFILSFEFF
jgi:hypothetical protein